MEINLTKLQQIYQEEDNITHSARRYCSEMNIPFTDTFRRLCSKKLQKLKNFDVDLENETVTDSNNYSNNKEKTHRGFTAIADDGSLLSIENYCKKYNLDFNKLKSYKLISHSGTPFFNCVFYEEVIEPAVTEQELKDLIFKGFRGIKYTPIIKDTKNKIGVVKIADLHLGSYVDNLIRTKDFSIDILANKLSEAVTDINERSYSIVHVHILGDLIESFTLGLYFLQG